MNIVLNTKLTELLGCQYPIIQTAMGWIADPVLTAATCNAGGFGFLAGATIVPEKIEQEIIHTRQLTNKNFGVNFHMYQPNADHIIELVIKHQVKAVSYSRAPDKEKVARLKEADVVCIPTVGSPKHAIKAIAMGADALTVQGSEGGGHTGQIPTSLLIAQVVDAVNANIPVVAAGGFKDGRGLVAAMAWGAEGIAMGTRFLMSKESPVPIATKQRYLVCDDPAHIIVSRSMDGLPQRLIINSMLEKLHAASAVKKWFVALSNGFKFRQHTGVSVICLLKSALAMSRSGGITMTQAIMSANAPMIIQKAMVEGDPDNGVLPSGQVACVIEHLLSCEEIITNVVNEAQERLNALAHFQSSSMDQV